MKKRTGRILTILLAALTAAVLAVSCACADGAEPHGDGNGIVSRPLLASLYKWLYGMDTSFWPSVSFEQVSNAVGKAGSVKEKDGDDHAAFWTDGDAFVTVTFHDRDGFWGVRSVTTTLSRDEYQAADISFLPRIGNREAGSSPVEPVTVSSKTKDTQADVTVTAELPTEYWAAADSFGEVRFLISADPAAVTGSSPGMRLSFWGDEAALREDQAKAGDRTEAEALYLLGLAWEGSTCTRNGMEMTDYIAKLGDGPWLRVSLYNMELYDFSEAEAILKSMTVTCGDIVFHYEPLWSPDDTDWTDPEPLPGDFSMDALLNSPAIADGTLYIEDDTEGEDATGSIYVYNNYSAEDLSFPHADESDNFYSYLDFDIIILHPGTDSVRPILRSWISLSTQDRSHEITSVTFRVNGRDYTFTELSDPEDFIIREDGSHQQVMLIRFDPDSLSFLTDLALAHAFGDDSFEVFFRGAEDIETEIGPNFWDIFTAYWEAYVYSDAFTCLDGYHGNPMESELVI